MKPPIFQTHHCVYPSEKNKEVTRKIRKGVHRIVGWIKRFNYLTEQEIDCIVLEAMLKRKFDE